ncbi:hypothetical protein SAMN04487831_10578 [Pseudobutyrivibrio sp. UC1225]|uniref:hypothetical protein n=1 Tax=Pseudobutyrivibrio sp. UC1225 TaxID=1798185 RepID=UPI0008E935C3|nr:hypothetical protein [Pseudobutyrivibrio sp. UC1225]SFN93734.1 hypothetical protein SAMN04487831_10578 [Pseudobutyrivibrio sp. UC1225]
MKEDKEKQVVFQTGKNVFAPVLNSYVLYVLTDAMSKGIKTLYFLARDAYFDYLIAEKYVKEFDLDIQCKYLYVSRLSLRIPLYHLDINQALSYITLSGVDVTPTKVINRTGLSSQDKLIEKIADYLGVEKDEQIPRHRLGELKDFLAEDDEFINLLVENSKKEFSKALNYLKGEGLGTKEKIAVVDSGWVGSIQQSLNVFHNYLGGKEPLEGYYYGLYEIPSGAEEQYYHSFLFGPRSRLKKKVAFNNCLFECVFSAPHGMTTGYKGEEDNYAPILSTVSKRQIDYLKQIEKLLRDYQSEVVNKHNSFQEICGLFNNPSAQKNIEKELFRFMAKPSYEEAEVFGKLHFSDDVIDYNNAVLASKLSERDLIDNHFLVRVFLELREMIFGQRYVVNISGWYEGSVMLYSKPFRKHHHLTAYNHYKYYMQYSKQRRWIKERERNERT